MYILIGTGSTAALVSLLSLAVFLLICCIYCYSKQKQKQTINDSADKPQDSSVPIYEGILPKTINCQETNIDIETNLAYSTVKIRP